MYKYDNAIRTHGSSLLVPLAGVDEILAAVREQVLLACDVVRDAGRAGRFPGVNVQAVLALLGKADRESHHVVVGDRVRDVFGEAFLLDAVLVQRRHEVGQRSRHPELDLQLAASEHQGLLRSFIGR